MKGGFSRCRDALSALGRPWHGKGADLVDDVEHARICALF